MHTSKVRKRLPLSTPSCLPNTIIFLLLTRYYPWAFRGWSERMVGNIPASDCWCRFACTGDHATHRKVEYEGIEKMPEKMCSERETRANSVIDRAEENGKCEYPRRSQQARSL